MIARDIQETNAVGGYRCRRPWHRVASIYMAVLVFDRFACVAETAWRAALRRIALHFVAVRRLTEATRHGQFTRTTATRLNPTQLDCSAR